MRVMRSALRRLTTFEWAAVVALGLILPIALYFGFALTVRASERESAFDKLEGVSLALTAGTLRLIDGTDLAFQAVDGAIATPRGAERDALRSRVADWLATSPIVERAFVFDARGRGYDLSRPEEAPAIHAFDPAFLTALDARPHRSTSIEPAARIDELSGTDGVLLVRAAADARGRYIVLSLHQSRLRELYSVPSLGANGIVVLCATNGRVILAEPNSVRLNEKGISALASRATDSAGGPVLTTLGDGVERYYESRIVPKADAQAVVVGVARADIDGAVEGRLSFARWTLAILWLAILSGAAFALFLSERARQLALGLSLQGEAMSTLRQLHNDMLDQSPASIAVLDARGTIVEVNRRWRQFAMENGYADADYGVGRNYLDVCEAAGAAPGDTADDGSDSALDIRQGIEDVIAHRRDTAHFRYPCNAPGQERWFEMFVAPIGLVRAVGAIVRHLEITDLVVAQREQKLHSDVLEAIDVALPIAIYHRIANGGEFRYRFVNPRAAELFGISSGESRRLELIGESLHPEDAARVRASYQSALDAGGGMWRAEFRCVTHAGECAWLRAAVHIVASDGREIESLAVLHDFTEEALASEKTHYEREHDELTGLLTRPAFERSLTAAIDRWMRFGEFFTVVLADIDGFHELNEAYGMDVGDEMLRKVADAMRETFRESSDSLARLNADKFGLIARVRTMQDALAVADRVVATAGIAFDVDGHHLLLSVSAGAAIPSRLTDAAGDLLRHCDTALERARDGGGGTHRLYSDEMGAESVARVSFKENLREAVGRQEFELHYQPKIDLASGRVAGCEALIRWKHPALGYQSPARFIPIAEETGLIVPIGAWVVQEACRQYVAWRAAGLEAVPIAVNVSAVQFTHSDVFELIEKAMASSGVPSGSIAIEVTESLFIGNSDDVVRTLEKIRGLGVEIGLDDFGTGFSSLSYLKRLPLSKIKADQSYVRGAVENPSDAAIVRSIVHLTSELGLGVVAEGVETAEQLAFVRSVGCAEAQGYYFSPPLMAHDFAWFLQNSAQLIANKLNVGEKSPSNGILEGA